MGVCACVWPSVLRTVQSINHSIQKLEILLPLITSHINCMKQANIDVTAVASLSGLHFLLAASVEGKLTPTPTEGAVQKTSIVKE